MGQMLIRLDVLRRSTGRFCPLGYGRGRSGAGERPSSFPTIPIDIPRLSAPHAEYPTSVVGFTAGTRQSPSATRKYARESAQKAGRRGGQGRRRRLRRALPHPISRVSRTRRGDRSDEGEVYLVGVARGCDCRSWEAGRDVDRGGRGGSLLSSGARGSVSGVRGDAA